MKQAILYFLSKLLPRRKKEYSPTDLPIPSGGAEKSPKDDRDYIGDGSLTSQPPSYFSLLPRVSHVENQGHYNSCVAHAITTAIETNQLWNNWRYYFELSRMHLWNEARKRTWQGNKWMQNIGCALRDGWKVAQNPGVTIEKLFPYTSKYFNKELKPSFIWKLYPPFFYYFIRWGNKLQLIKEALYKKKSPVVFGIGIPKSFFNPPKNETYKPKSNEKIQFHHAMIIVGWSDKKKAFLIQNSWGQLWGRGGRLWCSYDWIIKKGYDLSYCEVK